MTWKQLLFALLFFLFFLGITIFLFTYKRDEHLFINATDQLFRDEMTSNTLNMHYTLAYPENFDIYDYDVILPSYSSENRLQSQANMENLIALFQSLNG